jgi:hypothetical protein
MSRIILAIVFCIAVSLNCQAQLRIISQGFTQGGIKPEDLVAGIISSGARITNIERGYHAASAGTFDNARVANFPSKGAILSTGRVEDVPADPVQFLSSYNAEPPLSAQGPNYGTYVAALNAYIPGATLKNVQYVAFDLYLDCEELSIKYLFGSEEYPEWAYCGFNDAFAIFITDGQIPGQPVGTKYNYKNIALVPGTTSTPISIDNVNNNHTNPAQHLEQACCPSCSPPASNPQYYIENKVVSPEIVYDGRTVPLIGKVPVVRNERYRVIVIIADVTDYAWDSGVLLCGEGTGCEYVDTDPCGISTVPATVSECTPSTNKYFVSGSLLYTSSFAVNSPSDLIVEYDGVALSTSDYSITPVSPGNVSVWVNNRPADGLLHILTYRLNTGAATKPCRRSFMYYAPKPCSPCNISNIILQAANQINSTTWEIQASQCDQASNTYSISGRIDYANLPSKGQLIITNGYSYVRYNAPFANPACTCITFALPNLKANGAWFDLKIYFTEAPECSLTVRVKAPEPCFSPVMNADCIGTFAPSISKTYVLSAWIKEAQIPSTYTYSQAGVKIEFLDAANPPNVIPGGGTYYASGKIIDGWQKVESPFVVPAGAHQIKVTLDNAASQDALYDDIRIFPVDGNMKSYVYDPVNLRLVAELDENNYATLYEYDLEGNLVRVKKETERGVVTLKENATHLPERPH